jgi:hypothetical protein
VAAIDQADVRPFVTDEEEASGVRGAFRHAVWTYYHQHQDDQIGGFFIFKFYLRDVKHVIESLVGPEF